MRDFTFMTAHTPDEVSRQLLENHGHACVLAGGTDLLVQLHEKSKRWEHLEIVIDLHALNGELSRIEERGEFLHIGALCTHTQVERSPSIIHFLPFLSKACSLVGSPQIRNMGTIGGGLCNASPASDPIPPLIAADARIVIHGVDGERIQSLAEFFHTEGGNDLKAGEFVTEIIVRKLKENERSAFVKLGRRKALAISRLSVAAIITKDSSGCIRQAAIAPGCVNKSVKRFAKAEQFLQGNIPSGKLIKQTAELVTKQMIAETGRRWSSAYKEPALTALAERALTAACFDLEEEDE